MKFDHDIELIEALASIYPNSKETPLERCSHLTCMVEGEIVHKAKHLVSASRALRFLTNKQLRKTLQPQHQKRHSRIKIILKMNTSSL